MWDRLIIHGYMIIRNVLRVKLPGRKSNKYIMMLKVNIRTDSVLAVTISIQFKILHSAVKSERSKYSECLNYVWCSVNISICISNPITRWRYFILYVIPEWKGSQLPIG